MQEHLCIEDPGTQNLNGMRSLSILTTFLIAIFSSYNIVKAADHPPRYPERFEYHGSGSGSGEPRLEAAGGSQGPSRFRRPRRSFSHTGQRREGARDIEEPIEDRAARFYERGGVPDESYTGERYIEHESFFTKAYAKTVLEFRRMYPHGVPPDILKDNFLAKVKGYHHHENLRRGVSQYAAEGLVMTLEEYDMVRKHFLNQNPPPEGNERQRQKISALKSLYRKEWKDPYSDKEKLLKKMAKYNWTKDDIKPYNLPPTEEIREYVNTLRASGMPMPVLQEHQSEEVPATSHVAIPLYRSNREEQFDLNEEDYGASLDLTLHTLNIDENKTYDDCEEDEADMPYNSAYHSPFLGAYDGNFYRAYGGHADVYGYNED